MNKLASSQIVSSDIDDLKDLAMKGSHDAQQELGLYCQEEGNHEKAFEWYQQSAIQGNPNAQNSLGFMWDRGLFVWRDFQKAFYWYQQSANQNLPEAQTNLGYLYYRGEGVEEDKYKSFHYFKLASNQGFAEAKTTYLLCMRLAKDVTRTLVMPLDGPRYLLKMVSRKLTPNWETITLKER